jgi:hypothetical protein
MKLNFSRKVFTKKIFKRCQFIPTEFFLNGHLFSLFEADESKTLASAFLGLHQLKSSTMTHQLILRSLWLDF